MKGLYLDEIWNLFCNLMEPRPQKRRLAVVVDDAVDKKVVEAEIYTMIPTANTYVCWFEDLNEEPYRSCKVVAFERITRCRAKDDEYPNLKKIICFLKLYQKEFYGPNYLNWNSETKTDMSLAQMEEMAKKFLEDRRRPSSWGCE